jgi:hypothetical protein
MSKSIGLSPIDYVHQPLVIWLSFRLKEPTAKKEENYSQCWAFFSPTA